MEAGVLLCGWGLRLWRACFLYKEAPIGVDELRDSWWSGLGNRTMTKLPVQLEWNAVVLVTLLLDDSGVHFVRRNVAAITRGANAFRDQLCARDPNAMPTFLRVTTLNQRQIGRKYGAMSETRPVMDNDWFRDGYRTPLFREARHALRVSEASARKYAKLYRADALTITVIMSDGADNDSGRITAPRVSHRVSKMLESGQHIVVGCAAFRTARRDFRAMFRSMGIPDRLIMVLERDAEAMYDGMSRLGQFSALPRQVWKRFRRA